MGIMEASVEHGGRNLAVIFPGVGYTCAKPLLYYTAAMMQEHGFEVLRLDYGTEIHTFRGRSDQDLAPIIELALLRSMDILNGLPWQEYGEVFFLSKSIGTVVACRAAEGLPCRVRHFLMTPIESTLPWLEKAEGLFVAGTRDPYLASEKIIRAAKEYPQKVGWLFEGCDHSLERKNDTRGNIQNLQKVLECLEQMLTQSE